MNLPCFRHRLHALLAGGLAAPVESFIKSLNIPILSPALGDYYLVDGNGQGAYPLGEFPESVEPGTGAYPLLGDGSGGVPSEDVEYATAY